MKLAGVDLADDLREFDTKAFYELPEDRITALLALIEVGNFFTVACRCAGVSAEVFNKWMKLGADPGSTSKSTVDPESAKEPYYSFARLVRQKEALAESRAVEQIQKAGDRDWRAAAHFLGTRSPNRWGMGRSPNGTGNGTSAQVQVGNTRVTITLPDNGRADRVALEDTQEEYVAAISTGEVIDVE